MNLHHLRSFVVISDEQNVTQAARRLGTSQPAVSKQLSDLERDLSVTLFDRLPRGVRLTAEGQALLVHARRIFASESAAEAELAELSGLARGQLSVGASTTIGGYLLPGVLGAFHSAHPGVRLELEIANTAVIQSMVVDSRIDLGLTEGFVASDQLQVEVVHEDELVCIAAPGHDLVGSGPVPVRRLQDYPVLMRERGSGTRDVIEATLEQRGVQLTPTMALGSTEALKNAVASGLGLALVSRLTVEAELAAGQLEVLMLKDLAIRRPLHLVQRKGRGASAAVTAFVEMLHGVLGESGR
jgi:DNA-binding transcriptional LysR family regulator